MAKRNTRPKPASTVLSETGYIYPSPDLPSLRLVRSGNVVDFHGIHCPEAEYKIQKTKRPEKKTEFIAVRVPDSVKQQLQAIADQHDRPLSWLVCRMLQHCLERNMFHEIVD